MESNRKYESIFIAFIIVICLILGIVTNLQFEGVTISSICFAICITSLVYWFLGGIQNATFNVGYLKLGGSIAALLGGFYFINQELRKDNECAIVFEDITEKFYAVGKNSGLSKKVYLKRGEKILDSIPAIPKEFNKDKNLNLSSNLIVKNKDLVLGKIDKDGLSAEGFFRAIAAEDNQYEPFKLTLAKSTYKSESDRNFILTVKSFGNYNEVYYNIKLQDSEEPPYPKMLKNKDIKIINVDNKSFLIAITQADFTVSDDKKYVQFSVKPLKKV